MRTRGYVKPGVYSLDKCTFTAFLKRSRNRSQNQNAKMDKTRAAYFSPNEQQLLMETYEEVKHIICKKGNTAAVIENAWQTIADRLNA